MMSCIKCFIKDESYSDYKYPRGIYSRIDLYKCLSGPWFSLIEKEVFKSKYFIKKIPVSDRPAYIKKYLYREGRKYAATDYTAYEAHFSKELMESCEFVLYKYMTKNVPGHLGFWALLQYLSGRNHCEFNDFYFDVDATRMSGEMCTSLGNGFTNLMLMLFALKEKGVDLKSVSGVVEGDDGLFVWEGPYLDKSDFTRLGFDLKMEYHDQLSTASFCGMIFDPDEMINICDPIEVLSEFGWVGRRYLKSKHSKLLRLLRAKALSLAYQYPGCPILSALARYGLRVSEGYRALFSQDTSQFHKERLALEFAKWDKRGIPNVEPGQKTRMLMELKYGIPIEQQIMWEKYLDEITVLQPLELPNIVMHLSQPCVSYYLNYCALVEINDIKNPPLVFKV